MNYTNTQKIISEWDNKLHKPIDLTLIINNNKKSDVFKSFCDDFSKVASNINITIRKDGNATEPYIQINNNLIFKAIPEDKLLKCFLDILTFDKDSVSQKIIERVDSFDVPVTLNVYISAFCPFCPKVVSDVSQLAFTEKNIKIVIIDSSFFSNLAEKDKIVSAPTVVFNENFRWTGAVKPEDIAEVIGNTKPEDLSLSALKTIIEIGKASTLANLMLSAGLIFPAFYDLVTDLKWPIRLGAMVAMEEIAEKDPKLADSAIVKLWENLNSYDDSVKGDIIYMTGEAGNSDYIDKIKGIISGNYSDELKDAAVEAIESIQS